MGCLFGTKLLSLYSRAIMSLLNLSAFLGPWWNQNSHKLNLISKWFVMIVCSCLVENGVSISFGNGVKFELGCNSWWLGSLRILEHRDGHCSVAVDFLFCDAKWYSKSIECCDCRQHVRWVLPFRSLECDWVVKFPAAGLWAFCNLYTALLLFTYTNLC